MIKIAHRGNIDGKDWMENNPKHILRAINNGFDVEVDIRYIDKKWYLGHDAPQYNVNSLFLKSISNYAWFHCKNLEALNELDPSQYNFFWHQEDDFTLTSNNYIWTYPGKNIISKSIVVDLNMTKQYENVAGICTDYPFLIE